MKIFHYCLFSFIEWTSHIFFIHRCRLGSEFLSHRKGNFFDSRTLNLTFLFLLWRCDFWCAHYFISTLWKYKETNILRAFIFFNIQLFKFWLFKTRLLDLIFLLNAILFAFEESFITWFAFTLWFLVTKIGLKMKRIELFYFLVESFKNIFLFVLYFFIIFNELGNHMLLLIWFSFWKINSGIETDFIFMFVSFWLIEGWILTWPVDSMEG